MTVLECAVCGAHEGQNEKVLDVCCHHCGRPLCDDHRILVLDEQFANRPAPMPRTAFHCPDCRDAHHAHSDVVRLASPANALARLRKLKRPKWLKWPFKRKAAPPRR